MAKSKKTNLGVVFELFDGNTDYHGIKMDDYLELSGNIYLWVIDERQCFYYNEEGQPINYCSRFVINGEKIERPNLPVYNGLFESSYIANNEIKLYFNVPVGKENQRNFTLKIGKITDDKILNEIKNGNTNGFANLEIYAKSNNPIYEGNLRSNNTIFLGFDDTEKSIAIGEKLEDEEYYYTYVVFDDEDGKYAPIEHCLTLGQASVHSSGWSIFPYGDDKFNWKEFSTENTGGDYTPTGTDGVIHTTKDGTTQTSDKSTSTTILPHTGISYALIVAISIIGVVGIIAYFKNNKYKGI